MKYLKLVHLVGMISICSMTHAQKTYPDSYGAQENSGRVSQGSPTKVQKSDAYTETPFNPREKSENRRREDEYENSSGMKVKPKDSHEPRVDRTGDNPGSN